MPGRHPHDRLGQTDDAGHHQAADDDEGAGGDGQLVAVADEQPADAAGAGAHAPRTPAVNPATNSSEVQSRRRRSLPRLSTPTPGDEREVHRQQRQHARRDEREQAGEKGQADARQAERRDLGGDHRSDATHGRLRAAPRGTRRSAQGSLGLGEARGEPVEARRADDAVHLLAARRRRRWSSAPR